MQRRKFIGALGGAAAWPVVARAQQPVFPFVGLLCGIDADDQEVEAVRQGLSEMGYVVGKNVAIEYRSAAGHYDRLPELAADLVRRQVAVIVTIQGTMSALSAKAATSTIPIVFSIGSDPVKTGLVTSFNRPGGNLTGVSFLSNLLGTKRLELLRQVVPNLRSVGNLANPTNPNSEAEVKDVQAAVGALGLKLHVANASKEADIDIAFAGFVRERVDAIVINADAFYFSRRDQIVALTAQHALPAIHQLREFTIAGGLLSYGTSITGAFRTAGAYAGRILRGEKPADLPVTRPTKFELVINLKTAKALGLTIPETLLATADEVIQ
jgi:putative tryptophan/tyrosine transport system substrate-binding protein